MQTISLDDPAWQSTFPHRVAPLPDEWLPGLLLRCDEVNHWGSRTTLDHLLRPGSEKFDRCWRTETPNLIVPWRLNLDFLAQLLALPTSTLLATTYHAELTRLYDYDVSRVRPKHLNPSFSFHLCPACVAEARLLQRTLTLSHITLCPQHQMVLLSTCSCGTPLRLFHRQTCPFTCHTCGLDWADLSRIEATPLRLLVEQKLLSWYTFFFSQGARSLLWRAVGLINRIPLEKKGNDGLSLERRSKKRFKYRGPSTWEPFPLGTLVALLVERDLSPSDLMGDES